MTITRNFWRSLRGLLMAVMTLTAGEATTAASAQQGPQQQPQQGPKTVAFLGVQLENDNEAYEATSDAERARMERLQSDFKSMLEASGQFTFVAISAELKARMTAGQEPSKCGGCEIAYARQAGADTAAWIRVQKISNLILNLNVYMADAKTGQMTFVQSVDMRGNTDESWSRSLKYLVDNYLLKPSDLKDRPAG